MEENSALLIIDVQVLPFEREKYDGKAIYNAGQLLQNIGVLIQRAHSLAKPVVYVQQTDNNNLKPGTPLWEIHPYIQPERHDLVISKRFPDAFLNTVLDAKLQALNIDRLIIVGLQTEFCVDTTCRRAFSLGYQNALVSDGHSTYDSESLTAAQIIEHHNRILGNPEFPELRFAELKKTAEVKF
ncbi:MAG: cysteine hydrolase family protein [Bacillota bacterium]